MSRLFEQYNSEIKKSMQEKFQYGNVMEIPKLEKIVINIGVGDAVGNAKALEAAVNDLTIIAGQKPVITKAKKSIANFKVREGMALGTKVTLRGERMYEFLDRLINAALPRVVTSAVSALLHSMAVVTTLWVLKNSSSSLKSNMIR